MTAPPPRTRGPKPEAPEFTSGADAHRSTAAQPPRARGQNPTDHHTGMPSRFPLVSCEQAWACLRTFRPLGTERVGIASAAGRVLARDLRAAIDLPHFARSYMDGYAVRATDTAGASGEAPVRLRIVGSVEMGRPARVRLGAGETCRIPTGGMLPAGADAVVMVEHTAEDAGGAVAIRRAATAGQHVMQRGEDVRRGDLLFRRGRRLRPHDVGALAGAGVSRVLVYGRPRVAVIATGDEIVPPDRTPGPGQVRSINQYSLAAMVAAEGGRPLDFGVVPDRAPAIARALTRALAAADLVLLSGGSSVGTKDLTPAVVRSLPQARILVHGIRIKPGKPTLIARVRGKPVLGLPGNPVSALIIYELFGAPLLRLLGGEPAERAFSPRRRAHARLATAVGSQPGRADYVRVTLEEDAQGWIARPLPGGSAEIFSLARADGMFRIDAESPGLDAGTHVVVQLFT